jgi:uncharacterized RDD family membrane protein YckC
MACPVCGKPSPCAHEQPATTVVVGSEVQQRRAEHRSSQPAIANVAGGTFEFQQTSAWRDEVVSRVQQHRARRRRRHDPDGTMELNFQPDSAFTMPAEREAASPRTATKSELPKIIEFPKPAPWLFIPRERRQELEDLELADPVPDGPRILDAPEPLPEQMNLLPTFADIQLEAEESRPGVDVDLPPQPAPISLRIFAGVVDIFIVLMAAAGFAMSFMAVASRLPQPRLILLYGFMVCGSLWLLYQYLFLVYGSATVGMYLAQLELCTFRGEPVSLSLRRWRALASVLSTFALGLGFIWAFVDEDTLGWHDRMTQTHVRKQAVLIEQDAAF